MIIHMAMGMLMTIVMMVIMVSIFSFVRVIKIGKMIEDVHNAISEIYKCIDEVEKKIH